MPHLSPLQPSYSDEILRRLISMTNQTNLVALDKTLSAIFSDVRSRENKWRRVGDIADRIVRAAHEIGMTLPLNQRASHKDPT